MESIKVVQPREREEFFAVGPTKLGMSKGFDREHPSQEDDTPRDGESVGNGMDVGLLRGMQ